MRTKALLALALSGAGMVAALGQTSQNIVGYINIDAPAGLSMIANQLDNKAGNQIKDVLPTVPDGVTLYKWNGKAFDLNGFFGEWDNAAMTLGPGEGAFILNPGTAALRLTFVGEVKLGAQNVPVAAGLSIISSVVPQDFTAKDLVPNGALTFPVADGDTVYKWNGKSFDLNGYFGEYDAPNQAFKVGESFFFGNAGAAKTWTRTFNVN